MGSIKSAFQFESYKIDKINLEMLHSLNLLEFKGNIDPELWEFKIGLRKPLYFENNKKYIGGLDFCLKLLPKSSQGDKEKNEPLLTIEIGIAGIFAVKDKRFDSEIEKQLVKVQIPAILFPYIRGALTSLLANAGFGSVVIPLINIHELANKSFKDVEIDIIK